EEPDLGLLGALHRPPPPFLLDRIPTVAQPGGVGENDGVASEIYRHFDHVARSAGDRRGDRRVATRNSVEKGGLPRIRGADDRNIDAVAQPFAAMPVGQVMLYFAGQTFGLTENAILDFRRSVLVRKYYCRRDVGSHSV